MKVAIILSGCGVSDGAEIHESVLTLLSLQRAGAEVCFLAPDRPQARVIDHQTGVPMAETRNIRVEAARIARGPVGDLAQARAEDYDALFFPGGFGAATNLSDFASQGAACAVQPDVLRFAQDAARAGIPACFICIAPALMPRIYGPGVRLTIGHDPDTAAALRAMGAEHVDCPVDACVVDSAHRAVSTPAYMLARSAAEAATGIERAVHATLALAGAAG